MEEKLFLVQFRSTIHYRNGHEFMVERFHLLREMDQPRARYSNASRSSGFLGSERGGQSCHEDPEELSSTKSPAVLRICLNICECKSRLTQVMLKIP